MFRDPIGGARTQFRMNSGMNWDQMQGERKQGVYDSANFQSSINAHKKQEQIR